MHIAQGPMMTSGFGVFVTWALRIVYCEFPHRPLLQQTSQDDARKSWEARPLELTTKSIVC
jgi:hypothetical protein